MLIKTLNGIGNHYSPFPVRNSREAEACNDSKIRGTSVDSGLDRRPGDLGGELASIAWKPLTGPDGVHSSQLMDSYCTAFLVGVFLPHRLSPLQGHIPSRWTFCEDGLTLVLSSHIHLYSQQKCCVVGSVSFWTTRNRRERDPGAKGWARWQHQLLARSCVF